MDARGHAYDWAIRRVGESRTLKGGTKRSFALHVHAPAGPSGLYVLKVRRGPTAIRVPFAVQGRRRANVLVVLPYATWQGENPLDLGPGGGGRGGSQDGIPNTLLTGEPVPVARPFADLPADVTASTAPLLSYLDHAGLRYDIATDVQLAGPQGPALLRRRPGRRAGGRRALAARRGGDPPARAGHRRAGTSPPSAWTACAARSRWSSGALVRPTAPAARDIFGAALAPAGAPPRGPPELRRGPDRAVRRHGRRLRGLRRLRDHPLGGGRTRGGGRRPVEGTAVIVAYRLGKGLVVRFGLPELPRRLATDPDAAALMRRTWTLLSR